MIPCPEHHAPSGSSKPYGDTRGVHSIIQADAASRRGLIQVLGHSREFMDSDAYHALAKDAGNRLKGYIVGYSSGATGVFFLALADASATFTTWQKST